MKNDELLLVQATAPTIANTEIFKGNAKQSVLFGRIGCVCDFRSSSQEIRSEVEIRINRRYFAGG